MTCVETIVDAMLEGYYNSPAPVAPPKPTTVPSRPVTPTKPRPGTRPWNPSVRPGVNPRPKAREEEHGFVEAMKKFKVQLGKANQRLAAIPPITGMKKHTAKKGKVPFSEMRRGSVAVPPAPSI